MYEYTAKLMRVVDGDTVEVDVDLGFTVHINVMFRLYGIDAPEIRGITKEAGYVSKQALINFLGQGALSLKSEKAIKTDKYGRWLAILIVTRPDGSTMIVNDEMVKGGFAVTYVP